jgi:hypothetical protein
MDTKNNKGWPPIARDLGQNLKSSKMNKGKRGFEREKDKLPDAIAPLSLTWRR